MGPGAIACRHDHDPAGRARRVGLGGIGLGRIEHEGISLGRIQFRSLGRRALLGHELGRFRPRPTHAQGPALNDVPVPASRPPPERSAYPMKGERPTRRRGNRVHYWSARSAVRSRSNSPVKVDHLVTFIACQFVTGSRLTEILGTLPGCRTSAGPTGGGSIRAHAALPQRKMAVAVVCADAFPD